MDEIKFIAVKGLPDDSLYLMTDVAIRRMLEAMMIPAGELTPRRSPNVVAAEIVREGLAVKLENIRRGF